MPNGIEVPVAGGPAIMYLKEAPTSDHVSEPYPTIDPNGSVPEVYNYLFNVLFGTRADAQTRDSLSTLNQADPNIIGYANDTFTYAGTAIRIEAAVMSDGSRWFDLSGDGNFETHINVVNGRLAHDSDLNGSFDTIF